MILLTGGAGFIGSVLLDYLNKLGRKDIFLVDSLGRSEKWRNISSKDFEDYCEKKKFINLLENQKFESKKPFFSAIFHLGACSSTTESDIEYLMENNFRYSKVLAEYSIKNKIPYIYASSAATYGNGKEGFSDEPSKLSSFRPLNGYAFSKQIFDLWTIRQKSSSQILGLKFFNVFGPNEYHKENMKSVAFKAFHEIKEKNTLTLFKSDHPDYKDGEQKRDFIYVKDVIEIILECWDKKISGIYNLGSGIAHSWNELANAAFKALDIAPNIEYIPLPPQLKNKYQYYTCADMSRLQRAGITHHCKSLEDTIKDYYSNYLSKDSIYL